MDYVTDHVWTIVALIPVIGVIGWRVVSVVRAASGHGDSNLLRMPRLASLKP